METDKKNYPLPRWAFFLIGVLMLFLTVQSAFLFSVWLDSRAARRNNPNAQTAVIHPSRLLYPHAGPQSYAPAKTQGRLQNQYRHDDPFSLMRQLEERMNRMFDDFSTYSFPSLHSWDSGFFDFSPNVDFQENEKSYVVRADLPGLDKDKINVTVRGNVLTLQGVRESGSETQDEDQGYYAQERSYGSFARSIQLPGPVDETNIQADYKEGVLTVTLPKAGGQKDLKKISVQ
ncbi:MAG: hypothetical protein A2Z83_03720 [Omnitrophica bacterium GWA2_52_8]|nr:MAG: hypothetical protein A2Z83_03720 [Omnitrophica bacterium GWA2_52_8]